MNFFISLLFVCSSFSFLHAVAEKEMVIIIPSYNNEQWCIKNLESVCRQEYSNYRIIYVDDCSTDRTYDLVREYVNKHKLWRKFKLIRNKTRVGALENLHNAIYSCRNQAIMVLVDGDDALAHDNVLSFLNNIYSNQRVWLTYGQYAEIQTGYRGFSMEFPAEIIQKNQFRGWHGEPISHLRTFYAWLYKKIRQEDLMYEGKFYQMTWDKAMMLPMIEMAGERHRFIPEILYLYNNNNPISDHRVDKKLQLDLHMLISSQRPYDRLSNDFVPPR